MNNVPKFTIFTPVYNRRDSIHRVWQSICAQTYQNFEWIIVDDGSTDNVGELLKQYKNDAVFPITILTQSNMGKHVAWNRAVKLAQGDLFIPADSDDSFIPTALERFAFHWSSIESNKRASFSGVNVLCRDAQSGEIVGDKFPISPFSSNNLELFYKYKISGEKWGCLRVDLLKQRLFPEQSRGRGDFPLSFVFYWLAQRYKVLCVNEALRTYYQDNSSCLSSQVPKTLYIAAPNSYDFLVWHLDNNLSYMWKYCGFVTVIKQFLSCWRTGLLAGRKPSVIISHFKNTTPKILAILTNIPGIILYTFTYRKLKEATHMEKI